MESGPGDENDEGRREAQLSRMRGWSDEVDDWRIRRGARSRQTDEDLERDRRRYYGKKMKPVIKMFHGGRSVTCITLVSQIAGNRHRVGEGASVLPNFLGLDGLQAKDDLEMEFSTPKEASGFYNNYSQLKGFASRRVFGMHERKEPQSVITDRDLAMWIEIQSVFPYAHHKLCVWHHLRNAMSNICDPRFTQLFKHCMLDDIETNEFEVLWESMRCVDFLPDNEGELEFRSWYGTLVLQTEFVELEKSTWTKFTREMFARFRESLKRCVRVRICEISDTVHPHVYTIQKYRRPELTWLDLGKIPESLVLRRWSKTAKLQVENQNIDEDTADRSMTYKTRLGAFSQLCKRLGRVACMSDEDIKLYWNKVLSDAVVLEIKYGLRPANNILTLPTDTGVKDPIRVRTKGTGRCSQASGSAVKTKRKCSTCGKLRHKRTRCPNRDTPLARTNEKAIVGGITASEQRLFSELNLQSLHIMQLSKLKLKTPESHPGVFSALVPSKFGPFVLPILYAPVNYYHVLNNL
ncbi:hypothetical protein Ahy_A04g019411 [Arachis hypogaea]|uniref:MULE transposase domain-containing protein n=1 Tax=Arachis hypogaea TaxID=3818 RepID=A0A445DFW7_ARAHY|nr:hypothetical protein Ahy_A04g019411 [Arachis hypogaea]